MPADRVLVFDALYGRHCAGCHGADGVLGPAPPLNDPLFRRIVPETILEDVITHGRPGTSMAAFGRRQGGQLSAEQIRALASAIKGQHYQPAERDSGVSSTPAVNGHEQFPPGWDRVAAPKTSAPPYLPGETGEMKGDAQRGANLFAQACATCHGHAGEGIEMDGALRRRINEPAFLALISDQALRRIVITGRPDLGMPAFAGKEGRPDDFRPLTTSDVADLVALLGAWRKGTNGAAAAKK